LVSNSQLKTSFYTFDSVHPVTQKSCSYSSKCNIGEGACNVDSDCEPAYNLKCYPRTNGNPVIGLDFPEDFPDDSNVCVLTW